MADKLPMVTTKAIKWRSRAIAPGTEIYATASEAARLRALKWAKDKAAPKEPERPAPKRAYKRKDIAAAPEKAVLVPEDPPEVAPLGDDEDEDKNPFSFQWRPQGRRDAD